MWCEFGINLSFSAVTLLDILLEQHLLFSAKEAPEWSFFFVELLQIEMHNPVISAVVDTTF